MNSKKELLDKANDIAEALCNASLKSLCEEESEDYSVIFEGIDFNFNKQLLTNEAWHNLLALAESVNLQEKIKDLLSGAIVNTTEGRAALHSALREPENFGFASEKIRASVHSELNKMEALIDSIRLGQWRGSSGKKFSDVVFLGVGGSNLGPQFIIEALDEFDTNADDVPKVHFVSAMDGIQLTRILKNLNPETTMMIVCSKSFGTKDTLLNADTMLHWFADLLGSTKLALEAHTLGISSNPERMNKFGIPADKQLLLWDWVGGRFSFWSTVGFPIALRLGIDNFRLLLAGAHAVDKHFSEAELKDNIPVIMGLLSYWNTSYMHKGRNMVLPYDARLGLLADYLAQLHMESLGKHTRLDLDPVEFRTGSMLWGGIGTNSQHSFYQLLHQGTEKFFADFLMVEAEPDHSEYSDDVKVAFSKQFKYAHANCLAQSDLMAFGQESDDPNQVYPGNHPSVMIKLKELTPYTLGQLVALYEHRTYVNAVLLDINAFDQYGVEMGKVMAEEYFQKM